ncbi:MAG TPA: HEAT repeat domain-containing protein [Planctomycetaceae bacterium]|nr:HEAT repeat domain-containing protein [Planctomycetaceae bacterium]
MEAERETANAILDTAARLAKQTDDIRIIPNDRGAGRSKLESLLNVGPSKESVAPESAFDPPATAWKSYIPPESSSQKTVDASSKSVAPDAGSGNDVGRVRPEQTNESPAPQEVSESRRNQPARSSQFDEKGSEPRAVFDMAALMRDPEFREIHTRPVLDALELLSQQETRHRLLGALRIGVLGPDARTALPALRQFLGEEPSQAVRLRVAEAMLKLQPNDRAALETLSHSLVDPNDAELRQAAAGALGGAAVAGNPTAIVRLTDALDDPAPRVRIMAALSLAQFGPAAIEAVPRLEAAAANDVPRMQRAALAALASIRGHQDSPPAAGAVSESPLSVVPPAFAPTENISAPPINVNGPGAHSTLTDRGSLKSHASDAPAVFPDFQEGLGVQRTFESKAAVGPGSPQAWQTIPARGISLHELGSDGAVSETRLRHQSEPAYLPDVPARPLERAGEPTPPKTPAEPLSLEAQPGSSKAGSP